MKKNANEENSGRQTTKSTGKLTPQQVTKLVGDINRLYMAVGKGQLDIGDIVLEKAFQGSLDEATSRDPYKNKSMGLICSHSDLNVDRRRLGEYVRVAGFRKELTATNVDCSNFAYSHFAVLLKVDDAKTRNKLIAKAVKGGWSARKLADEIRKNASAKANNGSGQDTVQPSLGLAKQLIEILCNPMALMKDEEVKKMLANPEAIKVHMPLSTAIQLAEMFDELITSMFESAKILEEARENIALAYMRKEKAVNA